MSNDAFETDREISAGKVMMNVSVNSDARQLGKRVRTDMLLQLEAAAALVAQVKAQVGGLGAAAT